ncbi:MAG: HAMP domain-containing histidine kinase [Acidobacteria bacterium]|nr:HAMP domain-containing histidine kinase [Acidobacteriota bacterium]
MTSLKRRTISIVLVAELLCAIAFSGSALLHERRARMRAFDVTLEGRSDSLLGAIQDAEDVDDNVTVDPTELRVPKQDVFAVYNRGGRLLGTSALAPKELISVRRDGFFDEAVDGRIYRVYQRSAMRIIDREEHDGVGLQRPVTIIYAAPLDHVWAGILGAVSFYVGVSLTLLVITAVVMILLLRRLLEPIHALAVEAAGVTSNSLRFVPPESALRIGELEPLARALSETIERLRQAVEKEHRFVSDAAHELKTSIAVARSSIQLLMLRTRSVEEYGAGLERVLADNQRIEELVAQMLLLGRFEEGQSGCQTTSELAAPTERAIKNLLSFAERNHIAIASDLARGLQVPLAAEQIEILVSNLVANAVQSSFKDALVQVSVMRSGDAAVLQVRDWGIGIAAEAQPLVFDRFYREDTSRSRDTGGSGLGLAICKSIVDTACGSISLESVKGQGTTVTVRLNVVA